MPTRPHPVKRGLEIMDDWLGLPEHDYVATVYLFAQKLPPNEILEAVEIARAKLPEGGRDAFRYFCGVCHSKVREQLIWLEWLAGSRTTLGLRPGWQGLGNAGKSSVRCCPLPVPCGARPG